MGDDAMPTDIDGIGKGSKTLLAVPVAGKHARSYVQMRIRNNVLFAGFGHKLRARLTPSALTQGLLDGVIYVYSREYGFAKLDARCLRDVRHVLGHAFVQVNQGILVASREVLIPRFAERMAGVCIGVAQDGDDVLVWIICSKNGTRRLKAALPSYDRPAKESHPDEHA
jgi:hypothetical protein